MQLEDYFDFQRSDDIRIRGHRIGIETVLDAYLHDKMSAEQIQQMYPTLTLEQVYATLLYYHANRHQVTEYLANWLQYCDEIETATHRNPDASVRRLINIQAKLEAYSGAEQSTMRKKIAHEYDESPVQVELTRQEVA